MTFEELNEKIIFWAEDKDLLHKENSFRQYSKVMEEIKEVYDALLDKDEDALKDGIGDSIVTLIILAEQNGLNALGCLQTAYKVIEYRTGKTINGTFIKDILKEQDDFNPYLHSFNINRETEEDFFDKNKPEIHRKKLQKITNEFLQESINQVIESKGEGIDNIIKAGSSNCNTIFPGDCTTTHIVNPSTRTI